MKKQHISIHLLKPSLKWVLGALVLSLCLMPLSKLLAQNFQSQFNSISYRDGIVGHACQSSMISSDGKLWIYTDQQLNRYDGHKVSTFPNDGPPAVSRINNLLLEAPDGIIWAGSYEASRHQNTFIGKQLDIQVVTTENQLINFQDYYREKLPFDPKSIINLCSNTLPGAPIFICLKGGQVYRFDGQEFNELFKNPPNQITNTILPNEDGTYWAGRPGRIEHLDHLGRTLETYPVPVAPMKLEKIAPNIISLKYWPLINFEGKVTRHLLLYTGEGITSYLTINQQKIDVRNAAMVKRQDNGLWHIVSLKDWLVIDEGSDRVFSFLDTYPDETKGYILNNLPHTLYFDQEGAAYATLLSKVLVLKVSSLPFLQLFANDGLNSMRKILPYRRDSILLSAYSGLMGFNPTTKENYWIDREQRQVWLDALMLSPDTILTCTHDSKLKVVDKSGQLYNYIRPHKSLRESPNIHSLFEDRSGRIWVGTSNGLATCQSDSPNYNYIDRINEIGALPRATVRHITAYNGRIWVATSKGLYSFSSDSKLAEHHLEKDTSIAINYIHWASADTCWMATNGKGLWRWTLSDNSVRQYNKEISGFPNDVHYAVYPDSSGRLWIPSNDGLIWLLPQTGDFGTFTRQNGLPENEFNYNAHLKLPDGHFLFGGVTGAVYFHPDSVLEGQEKNVALNLVYYGLPDKKTGLLIDHTTELRQNNRIELSPLTNMACHLKVHVASYLPLKDHQYEYHIHGQQQNWKPIGSNDLVISGLPYGEYILCIRGRTNTYAHNSNELRIPLIVSRPYYERWYFWLLSLLTATGIGYLIIKFRTNQLRNSEKRLRAEVERRTQEIERDKATILRQNEELEQVNQGKDKVMSIIGHEIRGNLFFIGSATRQILQSIKKADYDSAAALSRNIHLASLRMEGAIENLTRWATLHSGKMHIQPEPIDLRPILSNLLNEHRPIAERKDINLSLDAPEQLWAMADSHSMNICLQNLIRNAIKFTDQGGEVCISCSASEQVYLSIQDSGIGMETETIRKVYSDSLQESQVGTSGEIGTGLGLNITKELVEKQSGKLTFESEPGKGTTVYVTLPGCQKDSGSTVL